MSVTFKARQSGLYVAYENLFHCGEDVFRLANLHDENGTFLGTEGELERLKAQPDYKHAGGGYYFMSGSEHDELELSDPQAVAAMRAYIAARGDDLISEVS